MFIAVERRGDIVDMSKFLWVQQDGDGDIEFKGEVTSYFLPESSQMTPSTSIEKIQDAIEKGERIVSV